ncbi:MAG TPA: hypothetical protein ENI27_04500 [bacterium]|nr:hypothetical protein [bacterium]
MMMFAFFPLFAFFSLLFFSDSLERTVRRRSYKQRETYPDPDTLPVYPKDISVSTGRDTSQVYNQLQVTVFRLAAGNNGRLTLSDVIVETGLDLGIAEKLMDRMVDGTHVRIEVNDRGMIFYEFPEIISRTEHEEV